MVLRQWPIEDHLALYVNVDPAFPDAWRKSPYYEQLKIYTMLWPERPVCICIGLRRIGMVPDKEVELQPGGPPTPIPWTMPETLPAELKKQFAILAARHSLFRDGTAGRGQRDRTGHPLGVVSRPVPVRYAESGT
jgi:hypothetical protein